MRKLTPQTRFYIIASMVVGILFAVYSLTQWNWQQSGIESVILALLGSLCLLFKVEGSTSRTHYDVTFMVYGTALILLGAPEAIFVIIAAHLVEWIWHRYPWYIQSFNIASYIIVATVTSLVYEWMNPSRSMGTWESALAMLVSMATFALLNHLMVGLIVWLARGENFKQSGIFQLFPLMMDWIMLCMGAGAALVWTYNPLAAIFLILPVYLIYSTLRVPALERQTQVDGKTGLYNLKYFMDAFENELRRASRFHHPVTVVMADLDLLRNINNSYGHLAGDEVLIGVSKILKEYSREFDVVCRFGGEEFAILMPETTPQEAYPLAQAMRKAIERMEFTVPTSVTPIRATMSFGIAGNEAELDSREIIHNSDMALYHAKLKGRNQTFIYNNEGFDQIFRSSQDAGSNGDGVTARDGFSAQPLPDLEAPDPDRFREEQAAPSAGTADEKKEPENSSPASKSKLKVNIYILFLTLCALGLFSLGPEMLQAPDWTGILIFSTLVAATEWLSVDIYARNTSISTSAVPLIAGILLFGPPCAVAMSLIIAIVALVKHKSPFSRFIFNASNQLLAGMACILLLHLAEPAFSDWPTVLQILASVVIGLLNFLITSLGIAIGISLNFGPSIKDVWNEQFAWLTPYYLAMGLIAYTLVYSYLQSGVFGSITVLVALFLLRLSQKQYLDRTKEAVTELNKKNKALETHSTEITRLNNGLLDTLSTLIDLRDPYVMGHSQRVTRYAVIIAQEMRLSPERIDTIRKASLMHDLGKLGVQAEVLAKKTSLTALEFEHIKSHVTLGAHLLQTSQALESLTPIVLHHHEHYDGKGYPDGLKGKDIPLEARIVCLADAVDAMSSTRPYRRAFNFEEIMAEVRSCAGNHFDPEVVKAFERVTQKSGISLIGNLIETEAGNAMESAPASLNMGF